MFPSKTSIKLSSTNFLDKNSKILSETPVLSLNPNKHQAKLSQMPKPSEVHWTLLKKKYVSSALSSPLVIKRLLSHQLTSKLKIHFLICSLQWKIFHNLKVLTKSRIEVGFQGSEFATVWTQSLMTWWLEEKNLRFSSTKEILSETNPKLRNNIRNNQITNWPKKLRKTKFLWKTFMPKFLHQTRLKTKSNKKESKLLRSCQKVPKTYLKRKRAKILLK